MAADDTEKKKSLQRQIAFLSAAISNHKIHTQQQQHGRHNGMSWYSASGNSTSVPVPRHPHHWKPHHQSYASHQTSSRIVHNRDERYKKSGSNGSRSSSIINPVPDPTKNTVVTRTKIVRSNSLEHSPSKIVKSDEALTNAEQFSRATGSLSSPTSPITSTKSVFKIDKRSVSSKDNRLYSGVSSVNVGSELNRTDGEKSLHRTSRSQHSNSRHQRQNQTSSFKINRKCMESPSSLFVNRVMGRSVKNVSRNKFKFVKEKKPKRPLPLPSSSSLRIDRRYNRSRSTISRRSTRTLAIVNGRVVKSERRVGRVVSRTSVRNPTSERRTMKIDRRLLSWRRSGNVECRMAQSVLNRSRRIALKAGRRSTKERNNKYCTFYNRFGVCKRGDQCPYVHDKNKVAVCRRFIQGKCPLKDCPFSHHVTREKMPVCSYYLRGLCTREECPYSHVNVNPEAEVCQPFLDGHCPLGGKCEKKHTHICPTYVTTGKCTNQAQCKLKHPRKRRKSKTPEKRHQEPSLDEILKPGQMPSFIRLASNPTPDSRDITATPSTSGLQIRPFFGTI